MKALITTAVIIIISLSAGDLLGQPGAENSRKEEEHQQDKHQSKDLRKQEHDYLKETLNVGSEQAERVLQIQLTYKAGVEAIELEEGLSEEEKRARFDVLIAEKNRKLEAILTAEQQSLIIPTTEREPKEKDHVKEKGGRSEKEFD